MRFVRRSVLILVFTLFLLFIAMYVLKTMQSGGEFSLESLLQTGKDELAGLARDIGRAFQQARAFLEGLAAKLSRLFKK